MNGGCSDDLTGMLGKQLDRRGREIHFKRPAFGVELTRHVRQCQSQHKKKKNPVNYTPSTNVTNVTSRQESRQRDRDTFIYRNMSFNTGGNYCSANTAKKEIVDIDNSVFNYCSLP